MFYFREICRAAVYYFNLKSSHLCDNTKLEQLGMFSRRYISDFEFRYNTYAEIDDIIKYGTIYTRPRLFVMYDDGFCKDFYFGDDNNPIFLKKSKFTLTIKGKKMKLPVSIRIKINTYNSSMCFHYRYNFLLNKIDPVEFLSEEKNNPHDNIIRCLAIKDGNFNYVQYYERKKHDLYTLQRYYYIGSADDIKIWRN